MPKAIIHNQMGMAFEMKKQGIIHGQLKAGDCQLQITTTAWMSKCTSRLSMR